MCTVSMMECEVEVSHLIISYAGLCQQAARAWQGPDSTNTICLKFRLTDFLRYIYIWSTSYLCLRYTPIMIECKQHLLPLSMRAVPPAKARELLRCRRKHWRQLFLKKHFSDQNLWRFSALASPEGINANAIVSAHQIMVVGEHGIKLKKILVSKYLFTSAPTAIWWLGCSLDDSWEATESVDDGGRPMPQAILHRPSLCPTILEEEEDGHNFTLPLFNW